MCPRYFPDDAFHATCNIDSFVWGLGSQGSNADWPPLVASLNQAAFTQSMKCMQVSACHVLHRAEVMAASLGDAQTVTTMLKKSGEDTQQHLLT